MMMNFNSTINPLSRSLTITRPNKDEALLRAYRLLDQMEFPYRVTDIIYHGHDEWLITYKIPVRGRYA